MYKPFKQEEREFLFKNGTMPRKELAKLFNETFTEHRTLEAIRRFCYENGLKSVNGDGRFKKR